MGRHGRWIGMVGAAVGLLTFGLVAQAWACNNPAIGSSAEVTGPVGPSQPVPFDFTGMDDTAIYTVSINGQVVASGQANGATVSGSFVMPDLGSQARAVNIDGSVTDPGVPSQAGQTFPTSVTIQYAPPTAPAGSNPSPQTTPASQPPPSSSTSAPQAPASGAPAASPPEAGSGHPLEPRPRGGSGHRGQQRGVSGQMALPGSGLSVQSASSLTGKTTALAPASHSSSPRPRPDVSPPVTSTAVISAPVRLGSSAPPPRPAIVTSPRVRRSVHARARWQSVLPRALPPAPIAVPPAVRHRSTTRSTVERGGSSPLTVIAGGLLALLALGASGAAAARVLARRHPPTPPTPAIAEGEEVVALSEADLVLQGVDMDAELQRLLAQGEADRETIPGEFPHTR